MHTTVLGLHGQIPVEVYPDADAVGAALAAVILREVQAATAAGQAYLLGCPGGRSPRSTYRAMGALAAAAGADLSALHIVMMDEYLVPDGAGFRYCADDAHFSCRRWAQAEILDVLNHGLAAGRRVRQTNLWFPDPADPSAYDERIGTAGGIDRFIVASGTTDGHVAFNPPGQAADGRSCILRIAEATRRDNLGTFPDFKSLAEVPTHGVSVGLGTIARLSRTVVLVAHGAGKRPAVQRLDACDGFDPQWPASILFACPDARVLLDEAAAAGLAAWRA